MNSFCYIYAVHILKCDGVRGGEIIGRNFDYGMEG